MTRRRKSRWASSSSSSSSSSTTTPSSSSTTSAAARAAAIQAKINAALNKHLPASSSTASTPAALSSAPIMDDDGNLIDSQGNRVLLQHPRNVASLKANQRVAERAEDPRATAVAAATAAGRFASLESVETAQTTSRSKLLAELVYGPKASSSAAAVSNVAAYMDPDLSKKQERTRVARGKRFNFHKQGEHIRRAQKQRANKVNDELAQSLRDSLEEKRRLEETPEVLKRREEEEAIAELRDNNPLLTHDIPEVEWWDAKANELLSSSSSSSVLRRVTHPVAIAPTVIKPAPAPMRLMLTKKERRKIRKQKRRAKHEHEQEMIRLGLVEPPEPRLTLSNIMRVMQNQTVANPSEMEAKARRQMADRRRKHEHSNLERMLTPEERRAKKRAKLAENTDHEVHVAVFRVGNMRPGRTRFKIDVTTQQYNLTGVGLMHPDCNVVVVEGGPKGIRKFKRMVLQRIRWAPDHYTDGDGDVDMEAAGNDSDSDSDGENTGFRRGRAILVWEGIVAKRAFASFRIDRTSTASAARRVFKQRSVGHYWDLALAEKAP